MYNAIRRYAMIALSVLGSATLLFSCANKTETTEYDFETLMTESSENRTITMMENGKRSYTFVSPLLEGYSLATNPYQEFRRGIKMTTYTDSLSLVDATITANYAIYYERQKLWEAKGNVVIIKNNRKDGDTVITGLTEVYTQQLFWNATTKKIYSNVDTKVLQPDGWHFGVGFDADEDLKNIHFRKYSSEMEFDMSQPTEEERAAREAERAEAASNDKETKSDNNTLKRNNNNTNEGKSARASTINNIGSANKKSSREFKTSINTPTDFKPSSDAIPSPMPITRPTTTIRSEANSSQREIAPKREELKIETPSFNISEDATSEVKPKKNN
jgi:LPS export ABC transporter protein LptC